MVFPIMHFRLPAGLKVPWAEETSHAYIVRRDGAGAAGWITDSDSWRNVGRSCTYLVISRAWCVSIVPDTTGNWTIYVYLPTATFLFLRFYLVPSWCYTLTICLDALGWLQQSSWWFQWYWYFVSEYIFQDIYQSLVK